MHRPVYMGSSIGGHLAIDLAIEHPDVFRAVVGLEASAHTPGGHVDEFYHPAISNDFKAHLMYGLTAPMSPEAYRRETAWVYSQGAPAVFKGDLYYYSVDHDVRETREDDRHETRFRRHPERRVRLERHTRARPGAGGSDSGRALSDDARARPLSDEREPGAVSLGHPPGARADRERALNLRRARAFNNPSDSWRRRARCAPRSAPRNGCR